ncbi:MAG TPA: ABC transporter permease [Candidatus Acidoferrales bacterium]|nr:ABC transporter permease [Candidatus Acidoferrales bacterium]
MFSGLWIRLRSLFRRNAVEDELDAELRFHFDQQVEKFIHSGLPLAEARRRARLTIGGSDQIKEECREARGVHFLETLAQDIRYALRMLRKSPGFTTVAVLTLALGIGGNTAMFTVVDAVLLKALPYPNADRIVMIRESAHLPEYGGDEEIIAPADFADWSTRSSAFDSIAADMYWLFNLTEAGEPLRIEGDKISASLFSVLRVQPFLGRVFTPEEDHYGGPKVALLGYGLWVSRFGADPKILGQTIRLDGQNYAVIGVMPKWFHFPDPSDEVWVPLDLKPDDLTNRTDRSLIIVGRLRTSASLSQAQGQMDAIAANLADRYPTTNRGIGAHVVLLRDQVIGDVRAAILILWGFSGLVLLIVCANIASLLLTRASIRRREFGIRVALGAGRSRLGFQLLTESLLLALVGGAFGLLLAVWGLRGLRCMSTPASFPYLPRIDELSINGPVLLFTFGVSLLAGVVFGAFPIFQVGRVDLHDALKEGARESAGGRGLARIALIVGEMAIGTVVLVGAGLLLRSFQQLSKIPLGFDTRNVLSLRVVPRGPNYMSVTQRGAFFKQVLEKIHAIPGVQWAGAISNLPLDLSTEIIPFSIEGRIPTSPGQGPVADYRLVTPEYFEALRIPLIEGRSFSWSDAPRSLAVAVISKGMARSHWPGEDPLGKRIKLGPLNSRSPWLSVVGVVGDVHNYSPTAQPQSTIYLPYAQSQGVRLAFPELLTLRDLVVRTTVDPSSVTSAVRDTIRAIDRDLAVSRVRTMDDVFSVVVTPQRFNLRLLELMAGLALILAAFGLYGVTAYSVEQRTHEIGVRMALGASSSDIVRMVLGQGLLLASIGIAIGVAGALALTRFLRSLLFEIKPTDPATFIGVAILLALVALAACYIPARRAMKVDPMIALRYE